ncbi:protein kinase [Nonomuraea sp. NPDC005692]|uniref:protein kinase domain-containing protein n=1 Tax=Nonomuraea sp. NPDC005692 TaxID=3157168 RepID=UPI0033EB8252
MGRSAGTPLKPEDPPAIGPYELLSRLGSGGMGTVYLARGADGVKVALKAIRRDFTADPVYRARFHEEVSNARKVASFCTARVLDHGEDRGVLYLVTEYIDGISLEDQLIEHGALPPSVLHSAAVGVAAALTAIHAAGLVHRDLKPANVMLTLAGPRVIDFGLARSTHVDSRHTNAGMVMGTPGWIAPEQVFEGRTSPAGDVFAWGSLIAYAGLGGHPFGEGDAYVMAARARTAPPDLRGLPAPLDRLVAAAIHPDPARRPAAKQLLLELVGAADEPAAQLAATEHLTNAWDASEFRPLGHTPPPAERTGPPHLPPPAERTGPPPLPSPAEHTGSPHLLPPAERTGPRPPMPSPSGSRPPMPPSSDRTGSRSPMPPAAERTGSPVPMPPPAERTESHPPAPPAAERTGAGAAMPPSAERTGPRPPHMPSPAERTGPRPPMLTPADHPGPNTPQTPPAADPAAPHAAQMPPATEHTGMRPPHMPSPAERTGPRPPMPAAAEHMDQRPHMPSGPEHMGHRPPMPSGMEHPGQQSPMPSPAERTGPRPPQMPSPAERTGPRPPMPAPTEHPGPRAPQMPPPVDRTGNIPLPHHQATGQGPLPPHTTGQGPLPGYAPPRRKRGVFTGCMTALVIVIVLFVVVLATLAWIFRSPAIGEEGPVQDGKLKFAVTGTKCPQPAKSASRRTCQVTVKVNNVGPDARVLYPGQQKLIDEDETLHGGSKLLDKSGTEITPVRIAPGQSFTGTLVFDLPKSAEPAGLEVHDSGLSAGARVALS